MSNEARQQWQQLGQALEGVRQGNCRIAELSACAQAATALRAQLPERFGTVLDELLNRLESSALFSEESCSFSQKDLLAGLQLWADKARERLNS